MKNIYNVDLFIYSFYILKFLTVFRKTVETGMDPGLYVVFFLPLRQWWLLFLFFDSVKVDSGLRKWRANQVSDDRKAWIGAKKGIHSQSTYLCFLKLNSVTISMGLYTGRTYNRKINNCIEWWWLQYSATYSRSFYPSRRELDLGPHNLSPFYSNPIADTTIVME